MIHFSLDLIALSFSLWFDAYLQWFICFSKWELELCIVRWSIVQPGLWPEEFSCGSWVPESVFPPLFHLISAGQQFCTLKSYPQNTSPLHLQILFQVPHNIIISFPIPHNLVEEFTGPSLKQFPLFCSPDWIQPRCRPSTPRPMQGAVLWSVLFVVMVLHPRQWFMWQYHGQTKLEISSGALAPTLQNFSGNLPLINKMLYINVKNGHSIKLLLSLHLLIRDQHLGCY